MTDQSKDLKNLSRNSSIIIKPVKEYFKISNSPYLLKFSRITKLIRSGAIPKIGSQNKKLNQSLKILTESPSHITLS